MRFFSLIASTALAVLPVATQAEERLIVPTPDGFTLADTQAGNGVEQRVFIPSDTASNDIPYVVFAVTQPPQGMALPMMIAAGAQNACPSVDVNVLGSVQIRGYNTTTIEADCPAIDGGTGPAEVTLMRVITGEDSSAMVIHRWQGVRPDEAAMEAARLHLGRSYLCDTRYTDRPCPAPFQAVDLTPPEGFVQAFAERNEVSSIVEYLPEGETLDDWTQMVAVQMLPPGISMEMAHQGLVDTFAAGCGESEVTPLKKGRVLRQVTGDYTGRCAASPLDGKPEFNVVRLLPGQDNLFVLRHVWSGPAPSEEEQAAATVLLQAARLCDTQTAEGTCGGD